VVREALLAYYRALATEERLELARDAEQAATEISAATERRLARGDVLELDVSLAHAALGRARAAVHAAEADREAALGTLRSLLGIDPDDTVTLSGKLGERRTYALDELEDGATRRPDLLELDASARPMNDAEQERQLVSLAYGNLKLENDRPALSSKKRCDTVVPSGRTGPWAVVR
jgi:outer membrane protein TolC